MMLTKVILNQMIENTARVNMLYDFYHPLLTQKQKSYLEMYHREDYSLGEISELTNVSRQAVYDTIRRTEQTLEKYEQLLHLYDKFQKRQAHLKALAEAIKSGDTLEASQVLNQLKAME